MKAFSREKWYKDLLPGLGARRGSAACRDMFCTRCPPSLACAGTLFTDFPQVENSVSTGLRVAKHNIVPETPDSRGEKWDHVLELLNPFRSEVSSSPSDALAPTPLSSTPIGPTSPMEAVNVDGQSPSSSASGPHSHVRNNPLVWSPTRVASLFWCLYDRTPRYYPELPLVQSPIQVADLGRPMTPLSLDSPSSVWTDSDTLRPSPSSGVTTMPKSQTLKRWSEKKGGRRVRSPKTVTSSGSRGTSPTGLRWTKPLRKAARWVSTRERRKASSESKLTRTTPRRRDAGWRSPSTQDYSVYFPRRLAIGRSPSLPAPPPSPLSICSQETFHPLFDEDPNGDCPTDDEIDALLEAMSEMPSPLMPTQPTLRKSFLIGWLDTALGVTQWKDIAFCLGWFAFRSTRLALRITLLSVPPLAAWTAFRASDAALRAVLPSLS